MRLRVKLWCSLCKTKETVQGRPHNEWLWGGTQKGLGGNFQTALVFWYFYGSPGIKDTLGEMMLNLRDKIRDKTREISQKIKRRP